MKRWSLTAPFSRKYTSKKRVFCGEKRPLERRYLTDVLSREKTTVERVFCEDKHVKRFSFVRPSLEGRLLADLL